MNYTDVLSLFALLVSVISIILSISNNSKVNASLDMSFYQLIDERERHMMSINDENGENRDIYYQACISMCNSYEMICAQYLSRRLSRKTFESLYETAIINIVESKTFKGIYKLDDLNLADRKCWKHSDFPNTVKVYLYFKKKKWILKSGRS